ncbi:Rossmann-fold NAD(P)-binding domain-containing protein [Marinilactibacillus psychrotolerans]|uniref:hypothetical protein n=1 Tax=Marinilactibacillus psychrotolerans TaxID=191770 RepID=UPI003887BBA6
MKILMYGVNKDTVSIEDIDKYTLNESQKIRHLHDIKKFDGVEEVCILSSEVRSEYYLNVDETVFKHGDLLRYLSAFTGKPLKETILETYSKFNKDVVNHLFTIVSGMEAKPKGSHTTLQPVEKALDLGYKEKTIGIMIKDLFKNAIKFSRKMRLSEIMKPLYCAQPSRAIDLLQNSLGQLDDKKCVLFGNGYDVLHIAKLLLTLNIQSLTIANEDSADSTEMIDSLREWIDLTIDGPVSTRLHAADLLSVGYRFSNADGIVFSQSFNNECLNQELFEKVETIRQTMKKQIIVDFNQINRDLFNMLAHLVSYTSIENENTKDFTEHELNQADIFFDENLINETEKFMGNYQLLNEKHAQENVNKWSSLHQPVGTERIRKSMT